MEDQLKLKIGFIGGGNMAKAICTGIVKKGIVSFSQIYVSTTSEASAEYWKKKDANAYTKNGPVVEEADIIFLAIKPHILHDALIGAHKTITNLSKVENKLFVSILAGVTTETLKIVVDFKGRRLIRVMPNTPMMVQEGCTIFCPGSNATTEDCKIVQTLLSSVGLCSLVAEHLIDPIAAVSGSGPAYMYLVIEALSDGVVKMGVPRNMATQFVAQTVLGAAKMVKETNIHPAQLKDEVCSPGGTTICGIHALEQGNLRATLMNAVEAATLKANELGQKAATAKH